MRTTRTPHARAVVAEVPATAKAQRWDPTEVVRVLLEAEAGHSRAGKSLLLEALGQKALDRGKSVSWLSMEDLGTLVRPHRMGGSVHKAHTRATDVDLFCIDDIGLLPVSADAAEGFYRVVEASHENALWRSARTSTPLGSMSPKPSPPHRGPAPPPVDLCQASGESVRLMQAQKGKGTRPTS